MNNSDPRKLARDDVPSRFQAGPEILQLLGDGVRVLHPMPGERTDARGGDVDCAVTRLDRCWPLRVPKGYRVVQSIHYDIFGWAWVLEHNGAFAIVDAIEDPAGMNRLGFPTSLADADGEVVSPASRAVYLAAKRVWKRQLDVIHWEEIRNLSVLGDHEFLSKLTRVFGRAVAGRLQQTIRSGEPPDRRLWLAARSLQILRRLNSPRKLLTLALGRSLRVTERLIHPTGFCALVLDPDGSGDFPKGTLARSLQGPLMRNASIERRKGGPSRNGRRGIATSLLILSREWLGFLSTSSLPIWWNRAAKGLIVIEGGWWQSLMLESLDIRARRLASDILAPLLPRPDLALVRDGDMKEGDERALLLDRALGSNCVVVQGDKPDQLVKECARRALEILESRVFSRLGTGWTRFPAIDPRCILPRGPGRAVVNALRLHQPSIGNSRRWRLAAAAATCGAFRLLRPGEHPPMVVREAVAEFLPARSTLSVAPSKEPGRYVVAALAETGSVQWVAKVSTNDRGADALERERIRLERVSDLVPPFFRVPQVFGHSRNVLVLEPMEWKHHDHPWQMPEEVAYSLGEIFRRSSPSAATAGLVHGDCNPLNLRRTSEGWVMLDWENSSDVGNLLDDVFYYYVTANALLGRPSSTEIRSGLRGHGLVGQTLRAYMSGAGNRPQDIESSFETFLSLRRQGSDDEMTRRWERV
jgi:hypothetical protein